MKKTLRICLLTVLSLTFVTLGGFLALTWYYSRTFAVNTWINGVYCTGKTVEEVNNELLQDVDIPELILVDEEGQSHTIDLSLADYRMDYRDSLEQYLKRRGRELWLTQVETAALELYPRSRWNAEKLRELVANMEWVVAAEERSAEVVIRPGEAGEEPFVLVDGKKNRLDVGKLCDYVQQCMESGSYQVQVAQGDCYTDMEDGPEDRQQRARYDELQAFLRSNLVYDMGAEQLELTPEIMASFLRLGNDGIPIWDQGELIVSAERIREWVEELARQYDTVDTTRDFQTTEGRVVQVAYNTYGTRLDVEAEVEFLTEELLYERDEPLTHRPSYLQESYCRGLDDVGDTYIEVDMGQQRMYYYQDGECLISVDVVTGNARRRWNTPEGINYVYAKQRNRTLRGEGYATPVKYWMPVVGNVGIHDADWRRDFGGEIYKTDGSHGCVNTPPDVMGELYELVEVGTPVVMFY
ncbi:MAG: L,D-transpeptidase family protein [bacterium]|nr:L,D-transpeptidase family protein [bacterium]MCM1376772.1 L,D-transpeptidase family protein [Muribaculum sp.]